MSGRVVDSVHSRAQEVAAEDYKILKARVGDAAKSGSYMYPIKGIAYFATHRALWKPLTARLPGYLALSTGVVTSMFTFTYLPQLAVMVLFNGPLAVFTTVLLVLNESSAIISAISKGYMLEEALVDTFDGTLLARNKGELVARDRQVDARGDPIQRLGKLSKKALGGFSMKGLVRYLMYLPLNFIPVIGPIMAILLQGRSRGNSVHSRYYHLKGWSSDTKSKWLKDHIGPYSAFGIIANLLEMIPIANILFSFTNTVGAALWAADIEAKDNSMADGTAPGLRETAKKAE